MTHISGGEDSPVWTAFRQRLEKLCGDKGLFPQLSLWFWESAPNIFSLRDFSRGVEIVTGHGRSWKKLLPAEERNATEAYLRSYAASPESGDIFDFYHQARLGSEQRRVWSKGCVLHRDNAGKATCMTGISIDHALVSSMGVMNEQLDLTQHAMDAARSGIFDWNVEADRVHYSERYITMLGYTPATFAQKLNSWTSRLHPADLNTTMGSLLTCIDSPAHGETFEITYRMLRADKNYEWILSRGKIVERNANGRARRLVSLHTIVTELQSAHNSLTDIANKDQLTSLCSRFAYEQALSNLTAADYPVSCVYMDLDGLKLINDSLDHAAGDRLLVKAAELIRGAFRANDSIARIGGDEFVALLPRCSRSSALRISKSLRSACARHNAQPGNMPIFISIGVACTSDGTKIPALMTTADAKMITVKKECSSGNYKLIKKWIKKHVGAKHCSGDNILNY